MKKLLRQLSLLILMAVISYSCAEEEVRHLDPMVEGLTNLADMDIDAINNSGSWSGSLVGFRGQRLKLLTMQKLIANGGYTGENYNLSNPTQLAQGVAEVLQEVNTKMDSVFKVNIQDKYDGINENSAGIVNFGSKQYIAMGIQISNAFAWLKEETKDDDSYSTNDLATIQQDIEVLIELDALNEQEVLDFVAELNSRYDVIVQDYAAIEAEVNSAPEFSKAQKELYVALDARIEELGVTLEEDLSLETKDVLDLVDRDLTSLTYFVDNNYTSPAQEPVVFGEISSITELRWLSEVATVDDLNNTWVLTADIDAAETARWNQDDPDGRFGFKPILPETSINFDGQFHIISGLHMSKVGGAGDTERSGMFAKIVNGSIQNLGLINVRMTKSPSAGNGNQGGTLVGWFSGSGNISKCFAEGSFIKPGSQGGGFIGRPQAMTGEISDCFAVVSTTESINPFSSSFIGLPVVDVRVFNCYNLGFTDRKAIFGHGASLLLDAANLYFDSEYVGSTELDRGGNLYQDTSPVKASEVTTDLPTSDWGDLANFKGWSSDTWEIRTETQFDPNPRPYLKGFNYDIIDDFIEVP